MLLLSDLQGVEDLPFLAKQVGMCVSFVGEGGGGALVAAFMRTSVNASAPTATADSTLFPSRCQRGNGFCSTSTADTACTSAALGSLARSVFAKLLSAAGDRLFATARHGAAHADLACRA